MYTMVLGQNLHAGKQTNERTNKRTNKHKNKTKPTFVSHMQVFRYHREACCVKFINCFQLRQVQPFVKHAFSSVQFSSLTNRGVGGTWRTIQLRSSCGLFCGRPREQFWHGQGRPLTGSADQIKTTTMATTTTTTTT